MVYFGLLGNAHILVYYRIISYQRIEVYRVKTTNMGKFFWKNGVRGRCNPNRYYSNYCTRYDILVVVIRCWTMPYFWKISDNSLTHQIMRWLFYDSYKVVFNVYDGILSHKLMKLTHCDESILCLTYYIIRIQMYTDIFIIAHCFYSTDGLPIQHI